MNVQQSFSSMGITLHSRYNPQQQAERFIEQQITDIPRTLLIVGAGFGYIVEHAEKKFPSTKIIALHAADGSRKKSAVAWDPSSDQSLEQFILSMLSVHDLIGLKMLYWQPGCKVLRQSNPDYLNRIHGCVRKLQAELVTLGSFGRRYLTNTVRNMNRVIDSPYLSFDRPLLITAPGTSLDRHTAVIDQYREYVTVLCVSSCLKPLLDYGIKPDAVLAIDAGFYAGELLRPLATKDCDSIPIIAFPQANIPSQLSNPVYFIGDKRTPEGYVCNYTGRLGLDSPVTGTVTAAALNFAIGIGVLPVAYVGLDLASSGNRTHCNNHSSADYVLRNCSREVPFATSMLDRRNKSSQSLNIYQDWFAERSNNLRFQYGSDKVFILNGGTSSLPVCSLNNFIQSCSTRSMALPVPKQNTDKNLTIAIDTLHRETLKIIHEWRESGVLPHTHSTGMEVLIYSALPHLMQNNPDQAELSWNCLYEHMMVLSNA